MNRRPLLVVTGWLVVGLVATGAGVVVTTFLGDSITGSATRALSPAEVRHDLDASPSPTRSKDGAGNASGAPSAQASPSATGSRSSPSAPPVPSAGSGQSRAIAARGGIVVARCAGGLVTLRSWTPSQGYEVKDAERGPRDKVRVRFEDGEARSEIEIRCSGDRPISSIKND